MDIRQLENLCQSLHNMIGTSALCKQNNTVLFQVGGAFRQSQFFSKEYDGGELLAYRSDDLIYWFHPGNLLSVQIDFDGKTLLVGPVLVQDRMPSVLFTLRSEWMPPAIPLDPFATLVKLLYEMVHDYTETLDLESAQAALRRLCTGTPFVAKQSDDAYISNYSHTELVMELLKLIAKGSADEVRQLVCSQQYHIKITDYCTTLKDFRDMVYFMLPCYTYAMISGGADADRLFSEYIVRRERLLACTSIESGLDAYAALLIEMAEEMQSIQQSRYSRRVRMVLDYIAQNINSPLTAAEIADHLHLNCEYLMRIFRKETGMTIGTWIRQEKVKHAELLLTYSERSCADIAKVLGYSSESYFIEVFRKEMGITPGAYRRTKKSDL